MTIYAELSAAYEFQPAAVETHVPVDEARISFISELSAFALVFALQT